MQNEIETELELDFDLDIGFGGDLEFDEINTDLFSLGSDEDQFNTRYFKPQRPRQYKESHVTYKNADELAKATPIGKGERLFAVIDGTFIFGDYIEALAVHHNLHIKKMFVHTLSMSENNIDSLANLIHGDYVDQLDLVVSAYFFSHERNNLVKYAYQELDIDNRFQLAVASTHMKICAFETHSGEMYVIHGSANMRSSSNIEQFQFEENPELYLFLETINDSITNTYNTINHATGRGRVKQLRRNTLWQAVQK